MPAADRHERLSPVNSFLLTTARVLLSSWIGAAVLFVVNGVRLVTHPAFSTIDRNNLALIRFPAYYVCGVCMLGGAMVALLIRAVCQKPRRREVCVLLLIAAALGLMAWDYVQVYRPLAELITPPDRPRGPEFDELHHRSVVINGFGLALAACAAIAVSWPGMLNPERSNRVFSKNETFECRGKRG